MGCPSCGRGFHNECKKCRKGKCHKNVSKRVANRFISTGSGRGAPTKDPSDVTDPHSTGRKRAAQLYPIFEDKPCEWRGKKNCGGGRPIIGCISGLQRHRHHGPVKNTLRNEPGNVHRICEHCHNRWHAQNDPYYNEEEYEKLPHNPDPELATEMELLANEAYWKVNKRLLKEISHDY
jgi:hypothetical protein